MVDVCFVGAGSVGRLAIELFSRDCAGSSIVAIDCMDRSDVVEAIGGNVGFYRACSPSEIASLCRGAYVVATALPSSVAGAVVERLLERGYSVVDVSFIDYDPYIYDSLCRSREVYYIVDAGFAPGFSNMVVGYVYHRVGVLDHVRIYVGGIPLKPVPPIGYQVTWSPEDLIEEYLRPARIVVNGMVKTVDPLSEVLDIEIPGLGVYEGFYSDGLRTLLKNIKARDMCEITIRYRGHLSVMRVLRELGFFSKELVDISGCSVEPYRFTARLFREKLRQTIPDQAILYIDINKHRLYYRLLSRLIGTLDKPATPLYTALVYTKTIMTALEEDIDYGVHPLENLHTYYRDYIEYLTRYNVGFQVSSNITFKNSSIESISI